jgi:hypothetical protein
VSVDSGEWNEEQELALVQVGHELWGELLVGVLGNCLLVCACASLCGLRSRSWHWCR